MDYMDLAVHLPQNLCIDQYPGAAFTNMGKL